MFTGGRWTVSAATTAATTAATKPGRALAGADQRPKPYNTAEAAAHAAEAGSAAATSGAAELCWLEYDVMYISSAGQM